jgi:hypothetical protein
MSLHNSSPLATKQVDNNMNVFIDTYNTKVNPEVLLPLLKLILKYENNIYFHIVGIVFNKEYIKTFKDTWTHYIRKYFGFDKTIIKIIDCKYYDLYSSEYIETKIGSYIMQTVGMNSYNVSNIVLISGNADTRTRDIPLWKICETSLIWGWKVCVISWLSNTSHIYNILNERFNNMKLFNIETLLKEKERYETKLLHDEWKKSQIMKSTECLTNRIKGNFQIEKRDDYDYLNRKSPIEQAKDTAFSCIEEFI